MTIIDETTNDVAKTGVSRRHFIQGAAAAAAGTALPVAGIVGSSAASAAAGKTFRVATGKQVHPAAPWETSDGSLFIISQVGEWLCFQKADGSLEPHCNKLEVIKWCKDLDIQDSQGREVQRRNTCNR